MSVLKKLLLFIPLYCVWVVVALQIPFGWCTACLAPGPLQILAILGYLVAIMIPMWLFFKWLNSVPRWIKTVAATGQPATATLLSVTETGLVINNTRVVVKLHLRVEPPNAPPFEVSQEKEVSLLTGLGDYAAGARLHVKYDPAHPHHLVILGVAAAGPDRLARPNATPAAAPRAAADLTQKLMELSKLHQSGELSAAEYAAAKKKLLG